MIVFDDFSSRGESRKCGLGGQKSRFHRHRTRPPGVDDCGRWKDARLARGNPRDCAMRLVPQDEVGTWNMIKVGAMSCALPAMRENSPMPDAHPMSGQTGCDPVTLEIVRGAIRAAQAEMEALIERTAISAFIREKKDFDTALFDADGVMAVGSNVPIFGDLTTPVFRHFPPDTMQPGDLYWYNDCYGSRGAVSHSNDQVLLAPVFHAGRRCAFVMSWAHFADIGGLRAGSISPD